jgi:hypothetical protein
MRGGRLVGVTVAAVALGGCLPFAWANPPGTAEVAGGARAFLAEAPAAPPDPTAPSDTDSGSGGVRMRAAFHPMGMAEPALARRLDISFGYSLEPALRREWLQGPDVALALNLATRPLGGSAVARVAATGRARLHWATDVGLAPGFGCSLGLLAEIVGFADGEFAGADSDSSGGVAVAGAALGEGGVGVFAEGGYAMLGPYAWVDVQAGIYLRLPMSAGVGIFCCIDLT